jgi:aminopeptidase
MSDGIELDLEHLQRAYAELIVRFGVNLQPKQSVLISAEIVARDFVVLLSDACYAAGARYVHINWIESRTARSRLLHIAEEDLEYVPEYEVVRFDQYVEEGWARIAVTGEEFPSILEDVDPQRIGRASAARAKKIRRYVDAQMSNRIPWTVVAHPTTNWAQRVFPYLSAADAVERLWRLVLKMVRADLPDPVHAWGEHDARLKKICAFMARESVRAIRYFDPTPAADGKPSTDLTVGLNDAPLWIAGSSKTPQGVPFMANMPTEEAFCSPHRLKADGWVRTSKPIFPLSREVRNAYFRFEAGECVEVRAEHGEDALRQFLEIPGTRRLGEVSLVDVRSPVNQTGLVFYDTLFDENACCHIAFGRAYSECAAGTADMSPEQREAIGLNEAQAHEDFMIGTPTMDVFGIRADGSVVAVMKAGMFVDEIFA